MLNRCKENERIAETCRLLKVAANVETMKSVETIVEVSNPFPFVVSCSRDAVLTPWAKARRIVKNRAIASQQCHSF